MKHLKVLITFLLLGFIIISILLYMLKSTNYSNNNLLVDTISCKNIQNNLPAKVVVYYFKRKGYCYSCFIVQVYTTELLKKKFNDLITNGTIDYRIIHVDEPENKHYIKEYSLFSNALVLIKCGENRLVKWKKLNKIWDLYQNKKEVQAYIENELKDYLDK